MATTMPDLGLDLSSFLRFDNHAAGMAVAEELRRQPEVAAAEYDPAANVVNVTLNLEPFPLVVDSHVAVDGNDVTVTWREE